MNQQILRKMGITEQDLLPLKKIKVPPEFENDSQFYQETIMKQYEKRRQRLLIEYQDLVSRKSEETQNHPKSLPPEERYEDSTTSRINDKLMKIKKFQHDYREQQIMQYSQKEQLIETRRKQISSERELRAYQKEVLETSRLEQIQRNRDIISKLITDKHVQRRMSYDAKLQKWELLKQAQYLIPRSTRVDETLARYQKCLEEKKQQDFQRLKRLEESLEKACSKKSQNIIEVKRRGLIEQLKIEEALFNRERSQNSKKSNLLEKTQQRTVLNRPSMNELPKEKPYPIPKFLCSKQQIKLNSQTLQHFSSEIVQLVDSINIHDIEEKLLQFYLLIILLYKFVPLKIKHKENYLLKLIIYFYITDINYLKNIQSYLLIPCVYFLSIQFFLITLINSLNELKCKIKQILIFQLTSFRIFQTIFVQKFIFQKTINLKYEKYDIEWINYIEFFIFIFYKFKRYIQRINNCIINYI